MAHHLTLTTDDAEQLHADPAAIVVDDRIIDLEGPGALTCLQGILTNDIVKVPPNALVWGAVLTPKGMIISDMWVERRGDAARLFIPAAGFEPVRAQVARSFPPRLAKATVRDDLAVAWITGEVPTPVDGIELSQPPVLAPFGVLAVAPSATLAESLAAAGYQLAPPETAAALRFLGGWPTLGREIDEKTLPQEVRFDELDGVRYDKGCYVGQETVARLHFRGHANRTLRGVRGSGTAPTTSAATNADGSKEVGTLSTIATLPTAEWLGLGKIRREVLTGETVMVAGVPATVVQLPFGR